MIRSLPKRLARLAIIAINSSRSTTERIPHQLGISEPHLGDTFSQPVFTSRSRTAHHWNRQDIPQGGSEPLFSIRALDFCQLAKQPGLRDRAATRARRDPARGRATAENCEVSALYTNGLTPEVVYST